MKLIVVHAFDDYRRGDVIHDPATVQQVWAERRSAVTSVADGVIDDPVPPAPPAPAKNAAPPVANPAAD